MKVKEMDRFADHCNRYLRPDSPDQCTVLHPADDAGFPHIDMLLYSPSRQYPFWKLITMGASDCRMSQDPAGLGNRNEYIMFLDPDTPMEDRDTLSWYHDILLTVALYPIQNQVSLSLGHSLVWGPRPGTDMVSAFLELPIAIREVSFLHCRLSPFRTAVCLEVLLLTDRETAQLQEIGPEAFSEFLYPSDNGREHFICERYRSDRF